MNVTDGRWLKDLLTGPKKLLGVPVTRAVLIIIIYTNNLHKYSYLMNDF